MEFGAGTGRLTKIYSPSAARTIIFDRSEHMLQKAKINLAEINSSIEYRISDNLEIRNVNDSADIIIEGWSFGHTVLDAPDNTEARVDELVNACISKLNSNGTLIFIETMGTDTEKPGAPVPGLEVFYSLLENRYGFRKEILRTDYKFSSFAEAQRITGYFFGEEFQKNLTYNEDGIVKEYTGLWSRKNN